MMSKLADMYFYGEEQEDTIIQDNVPVIEERELEESLSQENTLPEAAVPETTQATSPEVAVPEKQETSSLFEDGNGQLTLFAMEDESKKQVDNEEKEEKVGIKKNLLKAPKKEIKVNDEWTIHYATHSFTVSQFFEEFPEEGVTLEELRAQMEFEFFEMTVQRTHWDIDEEEKRLYPFVHGTSKGAPTC